MKRQMRSADWKQILFRICADFLIVQIAAVLSLVSAVLLRPDHADLKAGVVTALLQYYYLTIFLPLSLVFPVVFSLNGFYTRLRSYAPEHKWRTIARGTAVATLVYLTVSFVITRSGTLPRSSLAVFIILVISGCVGLRWLKTWILDSEMSSDTRRSSSHEVEESSLVLIVGGAGYIGSLVVGKLLNAGLKVRILDNLVYGSAAIRDILAHPNLELMVGDCRNIQTVVRAMKGANSVIHLAAIVGDPACEQDKQTAIEINYAATRMLIEIAKGNRISRFIFASSCSAYGASDLLMDEKSCVNPISLYGKTKIDSERALLEARSESFHPTILRLATVFGISPRPRFDLVVNLLTAKAYQEGVITIYNGEQWRPFIHVADVAQGFVDVLLAPLAIVSGEIFNLGDSRLNYTLTQVAEQIRQIFPSTRIEHLDNADRRNYRVSFDKIYRQIGFRAKVQLADGIKELKEWLESGKIYDYTDALFHNQRFLEQAGSPAIGSTVDADVMAAFATHR